MVRRKETLGQLSVRVANGGGENENLKSVLYVMNRDPSLVFL